MRSESVIVLTPSFNLLLGVGQVEEQTRIQALVAEPAVEALDEAVLDRPPRANEVQLHAVLVSPDIHSAAAKLRTVIDRDRVRQAAALGEALQAQHGLQFRPVSDTSAQSSGHSRVNWSMIVSTRK